MNLTNPFDSQNIIGYIQEVSAYEIKVHFPDSRKIKRFFHHSKSYHGGMVGSYVAIESESKGFIGKFIKIALPEKERKDLSEDSYKNKEFHPIGYIEILFAFDLVTFKPEKSINNFPAVGAKVYVTNSELYVGLLNEVKDNFEDDKLDIGEDLETSEKIELSANKIFQRHCAIVGTTGGGKSYTVSKIIEKLLEKDGAKVLLLDPTGEFSTLDSITRAGIDIVKSYKFNNGNDSIFFDYKNFTFNEIAALFKPAGQVQVPKLEDAIKSLKIAYQKGNCLIAIDKLSPEVKDGFLIKKDKSESVLNRYMFINSDEVNSSLMNIDIMKLPAQMNSQEFFWVADNIFGKKLYNSSNEINGKERDNCSSLILRIGNITKNSELQQIFNFKQELAPNNGFQEVFEDFYSKDTRLLRLDCSNIPEEKSISEILVNAIGNYLLNKSKKIIEGKKTFEENPLIVFIDEAHLFLGKKVKDEYSIEVELNAFERIAKECRKYGLFLCISTQRPRDIPEGILSQMGTFIVHRLINDKDKQAIENAVSNYNKSFLDFLPSLGKGEALLMGVDFLTTIFLRIQKTMYPPNSDTPELFKKKDIETVGEIIDIVSETPHF